MTFPPGFLWGVATGAHQTEGGNVASDWWYRENRPDSPVAERCGDAVDSYHRWPEDLDLAAGAGFTDYRFGIEWSRVEPADGHLSHAAVAHYRRIAEGARERGLRPLATLHHFTLPLWFSAAGGWLRPDAADRFLRYVDALAPVLGAGVERVETINEPNIVAIFPKLTAAGELARGLPEPDAATTDAMIAVHRSTVDRLRANHPGVLVGWGVSVQDYQAEPGAEAALEAYAEPRDQVFLRASAGDDFVGVQTYTGGRLRADGTVAEDPAAERTQTGWEYTPGALGGAVRRVARVARDVPIIVTENGVATADDDRRVAYTTGALESLREAMADGADVRGYFHWSLLDNWEWGHWGPTFGLVAVDRTTFARTPKPSLKWLGGLAPSRMDA
ncbi:glycoside hydrolase family 1 protein [Amycolatopsis sp. WQ 127309]|uniref:glycoside hydrolase family 1 protein n=1 Tax=Amycolatopsis sp. WQ 127309 TaxID=2932773 RepID=UPI001FF127C7|nr:family 1 glycosylhydrolase [Amycolatopsis sp. WQ 127309]UOZ07105.1 family 1 glycosylhydrolase [Amycolatopsis sp. WQ 127309]